MVLPNRATIHRIEKTDKDKVYAMNARPDMYSYWLQIQEQKKSVP